MSAFVPELLVRAHARRLKLLVMAGHAVRFAEEAAITVVLFSLDIRSTPPAGSDERERAVTRARIVLRSAEGAPIERIAAELLVAVTTIKLWRRRYATAGLASLADAPRPGHRPPTPARNGTACWRSRWVRRPRGRPSGASAAWRAGRA